MNNNEYSFTLKGKGRQRKGRKEASNDACWFIIQLVLVYIIQMAKQRHKETISLPWSKKIKKKY